uniref:Uncharacterized protein n=1 Tax=Lepeophtheirus salmonis TaxID=72036 RepID=A0A0K2UVF0_LEPSM
MENFFLYGLHNHLVIFNRNWPKEVIISFVKTRIRLYNLNKKLNRKNASTNLRKLRQTGQFTN